MTETEFKDFKKDLSSGVQWGVGLLIAALTTGILNLCAGIWWASAINKTVENNQRLFETRYIELHEADSKVADALAKISENQVKVTTYLVLKNPDMKDILKGNNMN